ncbi:MAG TPA: 3-hydroxy-3-methylglutaryl-CoA reductase [Flavobacteriaceae bacterium]|jgi:hydroxymethylglutaryl-CoA reductase (NADPH)|nr:3-hydroxy-3-methylglutaryl-CoA reductase [Flavobacteriaceae bacterium]HBS12635.1 3-hydroxy-3-methylglutaryl-CoA reductase [Flavobacteriaceae bacterium]
MSINQKKTTNILFEMQAVKSIEEHAQQLASRTEKELSEIKSINFPTGNTLLEKEERVKLLKEKGILLDYISKTKQFNNLDALNGNIENYIGMAQIPIGVAGPILINGVYSTGDYYVPLATTEGTLVASYNRGMKASRLSGGITSVCLSEGVQRSPFFKFENFHTVALFIKWVHQQNEMFNSIVKKTSNYAELEEIKTNVEGNSVILTFEYKTGDASGQNMVTICTDKICEYILEEFEIKPMEWYIESNYSGDKKATALSFSNVRGKKVVSEIVLKQEIVKQVLKTTPKKMAKYWQASTLAVIQSGSIGAQGHIANALTALFIACGQDVATVSESSIGITRMEVNDDGDLYVSLTLPSLMVGTVGGGTALPTQKECLQMVDCYGENKAKKLAEIACSVALAGEISIASAMAANHFTRAHKTLGRKKK